MHALFAEVFEGRAWPEGNLTLCYEMKAACVDAGFGLFDIQRDVSTHLQAVPGASSREVLEVAV